MAVHLSWAEPQSDLVRFVKIERSDDKTTYYVLDTVQATDDGFQKSAANNWVLEYIDLDGTPDHYYRITFLDGDLNPISSPSEPQSILPNKGHPYAQLIPGQRWLKRLTAGPNEQKYNFIPNEIEICQQNADAIIDGTLGITFDDTMNIPPLIFQIADLLGSADLIDMVSRANSPNLNNYARLLRERAYDLLNKIKNGEIQLWYDADDDGKVDEILDFTNIDNLRTGRGLLSFSNPKEPISKWEKEPKIQNQTPGEVI